MERAIESLKRVREWRTSGRLTRRGLERSLGLAWGEPRLLALWDPFPNWGDAMNPVLIEALSGYEVIHAASVFNLRRRPVFSAAGSTLGLRGFMDPNLVVWGTGFIRRDAPLAVPPRRVCAVRGPLTRALLLSRGVDCPELYGDPALLWPRLYRPNGEKRYRLGIVPHYADKGSPELEPLRSDPSVLIIDILGGVRRVIDQILSVEHLASSSLHGLVLADAYGIPSRWIQLSSRVVGEGFKFRDYFLGVGKTCLAPLRFESRLGLEGLLREMRSPEVEVDLDRLLEACPFPSRSRPSTVRWPDP